MTIKVETPQKATDQRWLNLFNVNYQMPNGKTGVWTFASRKENPQVGTGPLQADAVVIIPLLKDGRKRQLVTIKEFRIPLGDYEHGFPAGLFDENETPEKTAKRELKEETGLKLSKVLYVSPPSVSSAGLSDESVVYIVCECTGTVSTAGNEGTEDISVQVQDIQGLRNLCASGEKISAKALPFFLMFDGMNKIAWPKHLKQEQPKKARKSKAAPDQAGPGPSTPGSDPSPSGVPNNPTGGLPQIVADNLTPVSDLPA